MMISMVFGLAAASCCKDINPECEACRKGQSLGEFCATSPEFHGCEVPVMKCQAEQFKAERRKKQLKIVGVFSPACDKGGYAPMQCHPSTGYCWCVSQEGVQLKDTMKGPSEPRPTCSSLTKCQKQEAEALELRKKGMLGVHTPTCNANGQFAALQCAENYCWCVNGDGVELEGSAKRGELPECSHVLKSATPGEEKTEKNCCHAATATCEACRKQKTLGEFCAEFPKFNGCELPSGICKVEKFKAERMVKEFKLLGVFEPNCQDEGYAPKQCYKTGCWCVDVRGVQQRDSFKAQAEGEPDCSSMTKCQEKLRQAYSSRTKGLLGVPMPSCKDNGEYEPLQCMANFCWCVNKEGLELEGTAKRGLRDCKDVSSLQAPASS